MPVYDAFISYSHAKDKPIAAALQSVIQKLGKPWYRRRGLRVFRDDTSLSATPHLWPSIEQALGQSRYLILLASPEAAASPWVGKEVEYWLAHKSADTLFIGVTDGTLAWGEAGDFEGAPTPPLPAALKGRFAAEPKWVDLSAYRDGADPRNARFIELGADFAAAIHGMPKEDLLSQEVSQQRRALSLAVGAACLLLLLAVGAVTAGIIARREADRAERNFAAAKDTVNGLIFNIAQGLRNVEGIRVESLDKILGQVRKTVDRLSETDPGNVSLLRSRAVMLDEFAKTYLAAGNLPAALKSAEESRAILSRVAETAGADDGLQRDLSVSLTRIGDVKRAQGDSQGALSAYEASLAMDRKRVEADEANAQAQQAVAVGLDRIADLKLYAGDAGALAAYEEALAIRRRLAASSTPARADASAGTSKEDWERGVSVSLGKICDVKRDGGDRPGALSACEEELAIARRLANTDQGNTDWQRDIAIALGRTGDLKLSAGDVQGALAAHDEGLAVKRRLAAIDAANTEWQRDVEGSLWAIGAVKLRQDDLKGALAAFEESLIIARRLAEADMTNSQWQWDVSASLDRVGHVKFALGDTAGAQAANEESLAITRRLADAQPDNILLRRDVAVGLNRVGDVKAFSGDLAGALAAYEESVAIARRLVEANQGNVRFWRDLSLSIDKRGDVQSARGDKAGALAAYEESLAIVRRLADTDKTNVEWQADLVVSLYKIANMADGEKKEAALDEALKLVERLDAEGKLSPDKKDWKNKLLALRSAQP